MHALRLAIAIAFTAPLIAGAAANEGSARTFEHNLQPGGMAETCFRLEAGKSRAFEWTSDAALDFNIHYHVGDQATYPVRLGNQTKGKGKFTARIGEEYCWMWTAKFPTRLTGRIEAED